ncbi:MAG: hypothetical protein R3178_07655 [Rhodothermales bacterium]|nr:hypothetical protein [Rhodothermales bacterium]
MNRDFRNLFFYLSGLTALGFGIVGLLLSFGNVLLQACCDSSLVSSGSFLYAIAGRIWYPILWAGAGILILTMTVKGRE